MIRRRGVADSPAGPEPFGHLGWGYRDRAEFLRAATDFLADGLRRGQLAQFVGEGSRAELLDELSAVMPGARHDPRLRVSAIAEFYGVPAGQSLDPQTAVAAMVETVREAVDEGYTGLRAVADDTSLVRDPEDRKAFARYEFLMDRAMVDLPIAGMCAYDLTALGDDANLLLCLHPVVGAGSVDFRLFAQPGADFALEGAIDAAGAEVFADALRQVWPQVSCREVVVDVERLDYLDHNELLSLDDCARQAGGRITLRGAGSVVRRLVDLMRPANIGVEPAA